MAQHLMILLKIKAYLNNYFKENKKDTKKKK